MPFLAPKADATDDLAVQGNPDTLMIKWAFYITGVIVIPIALAFIYFAIYPIESLFA